MTLISAVVMETLLPPISSLFSSFSLHFGPRHENLLFALGWCIKVALKPIKLLAHWIFQFWNSLGSLISLKRSHSLPITLFVFQVKSQVLSLQRNIRRKRIQRISESTWQKVSERLHNVFICQFSYRPLTDD